MKRTLNDAFRVRAFFLPRPFSADDLYFDRSFAIVGGVRTCDDMHLFSGMKRKYVASTGVLRLLVGNRVGVDITRSTISSLLSSFFQVKVANN